MIYLLAVDETSVAWDQIVTQFGLAGLVLWYVGHVLLPKLLDGAREERKEMIAAFERLMKEQREHDTTNAKEMFRRLDDLAEHSAGTRLAIVELRGDLKGTRHHLRGTGAPECPPDEGELACG